MSDFERREGGFVVYRCKEGGTISEQSVQAHLLLTILEKLESIERLLTPAEKPEKVKINRKNGLSVTAVAELWNEMFTGTYATQMEKITSARRGSIQARIKEDFNTIEQWTGFFELIKQNDFLMGKTQAKDRSPFKISLEWVCKPANLAKIIEGYYHGR